MFLGCLFACAYMFFVHAILYRLAVDNFLFLFKFVMSSLLQLLTVMSKLLSPTDEFFLHLLSGFPHFPESPGIVFVKVSALGKSHRMSLFLESCGNLSAAPWKILEFARH